MKYDIRLDLFDGEGAAPGEASTPAAAAQESGEKVVYGKQASEEVEAANTGAAVVTESVDLEREFKDLVNGKYKDQYTQAMQKVINKRFSEMKTMEAQLQKQQGVIDTLSAKYGTNDLDALTSAIDDDNAMWEEAADAEGMTVSQYKEFRKLQKENQALLAQQQQRQRDDAAQKQLEAWSQEALELQKKYPQFDLRAESQNAEFVRLIQAGTPMEHAYKVIHMDEILNAQAAATEKAVVQGIRAKGARPQENGTTAQGGFIVKDDVSKLTKKDRAEIAERARRGEMISF